MVARRHPLRGRHLGEDASSSTGYHAHTLIEHWLVHPLGLVHLVLALLAVVFGTLVIGAPKGTPRHRRLGRAYLLAMVGLNGTALAIYELFGRLGPFHCMALLSLLTLVAGYLPARTRSTGWMSRHAYFMAGSYVGLIAALASEILTRLPGLSLFTGVLIASAVVIVVGVWLMLRLIPRILEKMR